jgi:hypothetical protein
MNSIKSLIFNKLITRLKSKMADADKFGKKYQDKSLRLCTNLAMMIMVNLEGPICTQHQQETKK